MRKLLLIVLSGAVTVLWAADWASQSGNPQRDGWAQGEEDLVKGKIQDMRLLYKAHLDNQSTGPYALTSPLINGNLITYLGFKELLFVGGSSGNVYAIDAALNRPYWKTHFEYKGERPQESDTAVCPGGMTASIAIPGGSSPAGMPFHYFRKTTGATVPRRARRPSANSPASQLFATGFGSNGSVFAVGADGYLRFVRQSDGNDTAVAPVKFVPAGSKITGINIKGTVVYAATVDGCGGSPNALYAIDLGREDKNVVSFPTNGSGFSGAGGTAIGNEETVFAQVHSGHGDVAGQYNDTVLALDPETLQVKDYFTPSGSAPASEAVAPLGVTPVVFPWNGKEVVVAAGADGTVYLLDAASLGGADHHTPLAKSDATVADGNESGHGISGDFATWQDDSNTRWIYAALHGPASANAKFPLTNGDAPHGSIVAFKVEERNGQPALAQQWISRDLIAPASPITTNGLVFALSTGEPNGNIHATMYALDGATGKELFSTGDDVTTFSHGSGLALANSRVYFTTHDNTVYCYGFPALEPQLTER